MCSESVVLFSALIKILICKIKKGKIALKGMLEFKTQIKGKMREIFKRSGKLLTVPKNKAVKQDRTQKQQYSAEIL